MQKRYRNLSFATFSVITILSLVALFRLNFTFDFEQFFPKGDPDLEFFKQFVEDFETDDNFLLVAIEKESGVFEQNFLNNFHDFALKTRSLPNVISSQSLTQVEYPIKTPFAITTIPAIHRDDPARYDRDKERILADERFVGNLISEDATAFVVLLKTVESIQLDAASELMDSLNQLIDQYNFDNHAILGRAYFQEEMVDMQRREIMVTTILASILVFLIMFWIFRKPAGIIIAAVSIGLGMLYFLGFMGWSGRELNALSALYPVLMIIVGTSDVIHIMSKYIDELRKGSTRKAAIKVTIREIGMATLLTSLTTAIGFASLFTSRIYPIRDFGVNSAIGVLIAYITVLFLTTAMLSMFKKEQIIKIGKSQLFWDKSMLWFYDFTKKHPRQIMAVFTVILGLTFWGISMITTNYTIMQNMPTGEKITEDFKYFEKKFTGFRPMEIAVMAKDGYRADDFVVLNEIDKVEKYLKQYPQIRATNSITSVYKSINQMNKSNRPEAYELPKTEKKYKQYKKMAKKIPQLNSGILLSKDGTKARITSRMTDFGADNIKAVGNNMDQWFLENTDTSIVSFKRTGTGLIIDKNAEYVRISLLQGLAMAIVIVCVLMALLFQNWRMLIISLVPNVVPLLLAGALLGFLGIELEAGISVVFAIIFGIAVDDTIHFLSKFKLAQRKGLSVDEALKITFLETGKAICLTTIILFFGFLIMLFSIHPPSVSIGLLISVTLFSAVFADLLLIPVLIRWLL